MRLRFAWPAMLALAPLCARAEDRRRPPVLVVTPEIGSSYTNLKVFYARDLAFQKTDSSGLLLGAQVGVRLPLADGHGVLVGAFGRIHGVSGYSVRQLGGFAAYSYGASRTSMFVGAFVSPAWIGSFDTSAFSPQTTASASTLELSGFMVGAHIGADVFLLPWLGVGAQLGLDVLTASRPAQPVPPGVPAYVAADPLYARDGVGTGVALTSSIRVTFGFF